MCQMFVFVFAFSNLLNIFAFLPQLPAAAATAVSVAMVVWPAQEVSVCWLRPAVSNATTPGKSSFTLPYIWHGGVECSRRISLSSRCVFALHYVALRLSVCLAIGRMGAQLVFDNFS